jgi:hypothetical protein
MRLLGHNYLRAALPAAAVAAVAVALGPAGVLLALWVLVPITYRAKPATMPVER